MCPLCWRLRSLQLSARILSPRGHSNGLISTHKQPSPCKSILRTPSPSVQFSWTNTSISRSVQHVRGLVPSSRSRLSLRCCLESGRSHRAPLQELRLRRWPSPAHTTSALLQHLLLLRLGQSFNLHFAGAWPCLPSRPLLCRALCSSIGPSPGL